MIKKIISHNEKKKSKTSNKSYYRVSYPYIDRCRGQETSRNSVWAMHGLPPSHLFTYFKAHVFLPKHQSFIYQASRNITVTDEEATSEIEDKEREDKGRKVFYFYMLQQHMFNLRSTLRPCVFRHHPERGDLPPAESLFQLTVQ